MFCKVAVFRICGSFSEGYLSVMLCGIVFRRILTNCYFLPLSATFCHMLPLLSAAFRLALQSLGFNEFPVQG